MSEDRVTYRGGPVDGNTFDGEPRAPIVESFVGTLDATPHGVLTPAREVHVVARYRWEPHDRTLRFIDVQATYRVVAR